MGEEVVLCNPSLDPNSSPKGSYDSYTVVSALYPENHICAKRHQCQNPQKAGWEKWGNQLRHGSRATSKTGSSGQ